MQVELIAKVSNETYLIKYPIGNSKQYMVSINKMLLGWIWIEELNPFTGEPIWLGSSISLKEVAMELGNCIMMHDASFQ